MIPEWLQREMEVRGLHQKDLARAVPSWDQSTVSKVTTGTRLVKADELVALLRFFGYPTDMFDGAQDKSLTPEQRITRAVHSLDEPRRLAMAEFLEQMSK